MPPPEYRPDLTDEQIFSEHTWLQGVFLACTAYGMHAILFFMSCHLLWIVRNRTNKLRNILLIVYIAVMFLLGTLYMVGLLQFTQDSFVDGRNIPGGPGAYEEEMYYLPIDMLGNVTMVMLSWMCDIINVWRCIVIYRGSRVPLYVVMAIPILMYFASVALGMLWLRQVAIPSSSPWDAIGINFTIPYYTMSLALNILVTILIVARLMLHRKRINKAMGKTHGSQYTSLAAMIVESAAIYSTFSLLFLIPFAIGHDLSQLFLQALSPVQVLSTFLIIFRVAQGKGWSAKTITTMTGAGTGATATIGGTKRVGGGNSKIRIQTTTTTFSDPTLHGRQGETIALDSLEKNRSIGYDEDAMTKTNRGGAI